MSNKVEVFEQVKEGLKTTFGVAVVAKELDNSIKVTVPMISNDQFGELHTLVKKGGYRVNLKRSGTGITILIFI
jgi:hypothetical protein